MAGGASAGQKHNPEVAGETGWRRGLCVGTECDSSTSYGVPPTGMSGRVENCDGNESLEPRSPRPECGDVGLDDPLPDANRPPGNGDSRRGRFADNLGSPTTQRFQRLFMHVSPSVSLLVLSGQIVLAQVTPVKSAPATLAPVRSAPVRSVSTNRAS